MTAARRCCRGAVSKQVGRWWRRRVVWRATAFHASACVLLTKRVDVFDLLVRSAVIPGPGLPRRLVRVERVGVVAGPLGPAVFLVVGQAVGVLQGAALKDHRVRAGIFALGNAERFGQGGGDGHGACGTGAADGDRQGPVCRGKSVRWWPWRQRGEWSGKRKRREGGGGDGGG